MKVNKITVDQLSEAQMEKVRAYLASEPNQPHTGRKGEFYGSYVTVSAEVQAHVDRWTARSQISGYKNVAFDIKEEGVLCEYTPKRTAERKQTVQGLVSLLGEFATE